MPDQSPNPPVPHPLLDGLAEAALDAMRRRTAEIIATLDSTTAEFLRSINNTTFRAVELPATAPDPYPDEVESDDDDQEWRFVLPFEPRSSPRNIELNAEPELGHIRIKRLRGHDHVRLFPWMGPHEHCLILNIEPECPDPDTLLAPGERAIPWRFVQEWRTLIMGGHSAEEYEHLSNALFESQMERTAVSDKAKMLMDDIRWNLFTPPEDFQSQTALATRSGHQDSYSSRLAEAGFEPDWSRPPRPQCQEPSEAQVYQYVMHCAWADRCRIQKTEPSDAGDIQNYVLWAQFLAWYSLQPKAELFTDRERVVGAYGWGWAPKKFTGEIDRTERSHLRAMSRRLAGTLTSRDPLVTKAEESQRRFYKSMVGLQTAFAKEQDELLHAPDLTRAEFEKEFLKIAASQAARLHELWWEQRVPERNEENRLSSLSWRDDRVVYDDGRTAQDVETGDTECYGTNIDKWRDSDRTGLRPLVKCQICLDEMCVPGIPRSGRERELAYDLLACGHVIGLDCLHTMAHTEGWQRTCPICRAKIAPEDAREMHRHWRQMEAAGENDFEDLALFLPYPDEIKAGLSRFGGFKEIKAQSTTSSGEQQVLDHQAAVAETKNISRKRKRESMDTEEGGCEMRQGISKRAKA